MFVHLNAHSVYSKMRGTISLKELIDLAQSHQAGSLALTDVNTVRGFINFVHSAQDRNIAPIAGVNLITNIDEVVILAENHAGYENMCRVITECYTDPDRSAADILRQRSSGLFVLTYQPSLIKRLHSFMSDTQLFVELRPGIKETMVQKLSKKYRLEMVATGDVYFKDSTEHHSHKILRAINNNTTLKELEKEHYKSKDHWFRAESDMVRLFPNSLDAINNSHYLAQRCKRKWSFVNTIFPGLSLKDTYQSNKKLRDYAYQGAMVRYERVTDRIKKRIEYEMNLITQKGFAPYFLIVRDIVSQTRATIGRGSAAASVVSYCLFITQVDPIKYNLVFDRFIHPERSDMPDIDIDFPRAIREKLIPRIHEYFGPQFAVLTGMITRYKSKGILRDLGKVFGIPDGDISTLSRKINNSDPALLKSEMLSIPEFKKVVDLPEWENIISLASQLKNAPKALGQHVGGMILSSSPISEMVPFRRSALDGRYIIDWDKDSIADAGFAKIDILSLPVLDQIDEAILLIKDTKNELVDISQIDPEDSDVFDMINRGLSKGVFLLQSPAQLKMGQRLLSRNLNDLAYQVALIRPGVGVQGNSVSQFVDRYRYGTPWQYDHYLEKRALERTCGIIVWQEQVVQLISDISGISQAESDEMRRGFARSNNESLIKGYWDRFKKGAVDNGIPEEISHKIFSKINGQYMFPESHSHAFAISAYQSAWLKTHYPLEFYVSLINNQPMGFYPLETLKQDARKFGIDFCNPDINLSQDKCTIDGNSLLIGLEFINGVGVRNAKNILDERNLRGPFDSVGDFVRRVQTKPDAIEALIFSGAFDLIEPNRKLALWKSGLYKGPSGHQITLPISMDDSTPDLMDFSNHEKMIFEYEFMGMYPKGHIMEFIRPLLPKDVLSTYEVYSMEEGEIVSVCGIGIARQHPRGHKGTVFVTVEDECSDVQLILWPDIHKKYMDVLKDPIILAKGKISRQDGTTSVVVSHLETLEPKNGLPSAHNWH